MRKLKKKIWFTFFLTALFYANVCIADIAASSDEIKASEPKKNSGDSETIKARPAKINKETRFYRIEPDIITNLNYQRSPQYLHTRIELMTQGEANLKVLEYHDSAIRDKFLIYFNHLKKRNFQTPKRKAKVQEQMLELVQRLMRKEVGRPVVDKVILSMIYIE